MKAKVPLFRSSPVRSVTIDTDATNGAVIGDNLWNADGTLFDPSQTITQIVNQTIEEGGGDGGTGISLDDVQVDGDGLVNVAGSLAQGAVDISLDVGVAWMLAA